MFKPMRITFHLDGTGIYYDPFEPPMLDALLSAAVCRWHVHGEPPARDETPFEIPLPLAKWELGGVWGWRASALFPEGATAESMQHWRKRYRQHRAELAAGAPNLSQGAYRDWNMTFPLLLSLAMTAYAVGEVRKVRRELARSIRYLGKKRAHGRGAVVGIDVEEIAEDLSCVRDGKAQRYLPLSDGLRVVRPRPPYWNRTGAVPCCEIGDEL